MAIYDNNEDNMTKVCLNYNMSWEFGLYWNNKLIPREFYKLNQSYYKASWLILDINRHYRMSLYEVDIVVVSRIFGNFTMVLLNKRNPEIYEHRYIRCKRIWKPDLYMIGQIINQALENAKKKMQELKLYMNLIGCERWSGYSKARNERVSDVWTSVRLSDLWNYNKFLVFRKANYSRHFSLLGYFNR
ncbi:hypothetical protein RhiirA5_433376 [Rhizophagus irregularis]|uniref:Uncharacterized protein n=1 Tax=Rhizophagus irregularis TaxID=588596 RepID=A0A2N0NRY8_9GLOM|nr:hypothetical protein RhiirA5_433376 [Rhizophagus irregularis]